MKINFIEAIMFDMGRNKVKIKLPKKNRDLQRLLIKKNIIKPDQKEIKHLDSKIKSVVDIEIKNFNIKAPTNIYYLNSYLEILKEEKLDIPKNDIDITTQKLKEMIAEILNLERNDLDLKEIYDLINIKNVKEKEVEETNNNNKLIFSIKDLQKKARERKAK